MDARLAIVPLVAMAAFGATYVLIIALSAGFDDAPTAVGSEMRVVDGDTELQSLLERMWMADADDRASTNDVQLNWGSHIVGDGDAGARGTGNQSVTNSSLFASVNESMFEHNPLYSSLISIYNDELFNASVCTNEPLLRGERLAKLHSHFVLLTNTTVFQHVFDYLTERRIVPDDFEAFSAQLFRLWFGSYSRCAATFGSNSRPEKIHGSSGWERLFVGEIHDKEGANRGRVEGLHNWVRFYLLEKADEITYHGYLNRISDTEEDNRDVLVAGSFRYEWRGKLQPSGTFLIRTSPAYDFALYTVCALAHPGIGGCAFQLDSGERLNVNSEFMRCGRRAGSRLTNARCIGTVYPSFPVA